MTELEDDDPRLGFRVQDEDPFNFFDAMALTFVGILGVVAILWVAGAVVIGLIKYPLVFAGILGGVGVFLLMSWAVYKTSK